MSSLDIKQITSIIKEKISTYQEQLKSGGSDDKESTEKDSLQLLKQSDVLQESKCFNEPSLNYKKCIQILSRLIYLMNQGEKLSDLESQNLFFSITKLFSYENKELRRMIYLMIKEFKLEASVYIVTASLIKDISSKTDLFRMNALRVIPLVIDQSNLVSIDRLLKLALIDKNYAISSSGLMSGIQLYQDNQELVKKWQNEINERLSAKSINNNFHALILLNLIKQTDKISFNKTIVKCIKENYSQLTTIQLVRFIHSILKTSFSSLEESTEQLLIDYLQRQAHKSNDMIVFEVCKVLCDLPNVSNSDLSSIVSILMMFVQSLNNVHKFMALKIINKLIQNPARHTLIQNIGDIEALISDQNKGLSSLAVSILLKMCQESNIDKLLSQIYDNLSDMSDEFKQDILRSVSQLIKTAPKRYKTVLMFLTQCMKSESSYNFKKYAIDIVEYIIQEIPASKQLALTQLAEYIEDCQYPYLQLQILSLMNKETEKKLAPAKIIRQINNRIHLEKSEIRAAALSIIGKFGKRYDDQTQAMVNLLKQTLNDLDEEVRERGLYYIDNLENKNNKEQQQLQNNLFEIDMQQIDLYEQFAKNAQQQDDQALENEDLLAQENIEQFKEQNPQLFVNKKYEDQEIKIDSYQDFENQQQNQKEINEPQNQLEKDQEYEKYKNLFENHDIFSHYGQLRNISTQKALTDQDCECEVSIKKFFFDEFVVVEYQVYNRVDDRQLKEVNIEFKPDNENIKQLHSIPSDLIKYNECGYVYIGLQKNPEEKIVATNIESILTYQIEEIDGSGQPQQSYQDDFQLDDFNIVVSEYLSKFNLAKGKFQLIWDSLDVEPEGNQFMLRFKNLDHGVKELIKHFDISICEETHKIKDPKKPHTLLLSGKYLETYNFLTQIKIAYDANRAACLLKIQVKSQDPTLSINIANSISM